MTTAAKEKAALREDGLSAQLPMSALGLLPSKSPILRMGVSMITSGKVRFKENIEKIIRTIQKAKNPPLFVFLVTRKAGYWHLEKTLLGRLFYA